MARNKKGGTGSRFKGQQFPRRNGGFRANPSGGNGSNISPSASQGFVRAHGYTLAEEARNTAFNRRGALGRDAQLRYKPVAFISAGLMEPLKDLEMQLTTVDEAQVNADTTSEPATAAVDTVLSKDTASSHPNPTLDRESNFGQLSATELSKLSAAKGSSVQKSRQHSNLSSDQDLDSSEEVILFKGRDRSRQEPIPAPVDLGQDDASNNSFKLRELDREIQVVEETLHRDTANPDNGAKMDDYISLDSKPKTRGKQRKIRKSSTSDEEAAMIADYMANMKDWKEEEDADEDVVDLDLGFHTFNILRDLGGTDSDAVPGGFCSEVGTDEGSEDGVGSEDQERRLNADEQMARMLAKQEGLGLGGDDIVLFDGEDSGDEWSTAPKVHPRRKRKGDLKRAKITQKQGQYPSATQMADAFDELDLMDWHRPSLNNFKKGQPSFNVSDSELEEVMKSTWQKDRLKKAEKKRAREELRSQGLLGKNIDRDDPRVKYVGGMSLDDLADELENFLLGSQEQLTLPPFDKATRKTIHALANKFKIKSQSAGKGKDRYPVLYRSKATLRFDQNTFDRTFNRIKQPWFPRVDVDDKLVNESRILKRAEARNGKSRFKNTLTYRDGDVVGQHAAELGVENKGRAMLEKMGWSKGMALGTEENKGIMVPITQVVRKSKAGLGDA